MAFFYALRFDIKATCLSPLRTVDPQSDESTVLRDKSGRAFIQASSIAGAMRCWSEANMGTSLTKELFGNILAESSLAFSDGLFSESSTEAIRPRIELNQNTKSLSGSNLGKFNISAMTAGSVFTFSILWKGKEQEDMETAQKAIVTLLSAMNSGEILLGSQKTNGYGRVSLSVKKRAFDLKIFEDQMAWLNQSEAEEECPLEEVSSNDYVVFSVKAKSNSILVKPNISSANGNVLLNICENDTFILPASSIKGAVRWRVEDIAKKRCNFSQEDIDFLFGNVTDEEPIIGKIIFSDAPLISSGVPKTLNRIKVNRFTSGVMLRKLFFENPLNNVDLEFQISVPCDDKVACGIILFALRDLGLKLYSLGSGGAIGRGFLDVEKIVAKSPDREDVVMVFDKGAKIVSGKSIADEWLGAINRRGEI